jgi:hypothetical protein
MYNVVSCLVTSFYIMRGCIGYYIIGMHYSEVQCLLKTVNYSHFLQKNLSSIAWIFKRVRGPQITRRPSRMKFNQTAKRSAIFAISGLLVRLIASRYPVALMQERRTGPLYKYLLPLAFQLGIMPAITLRYLRKDTTAGAEFFSVLASYFCGDAIAHLGVMRPIYLLHHVAGLIACQLAADTGPHTSMCVLLSATLELGSAVANIHDVVPVRLARNRWFACMARYVFILSSIIPVCIGPWFVRDLKSGSSWFLCVGVMIGGLVRLRHIPTIRDGTC